jgi:hypothetical protein
MIKFEFTLNNRDASNLIDILHNEHVRILEHAQTFIKPMTSMTRADQANHDWYIGHAGYLKSLKEKVLAGNKQVESEWTETVELNLSDSEFLTLARMAHEKDITFNQLVNEILLEIINKWNT